MANWIYYLHSINPYFSINDVGLYKQNLDYMGSCTIFNSILKLLNYKFKLSNNPQILCEKNYVASLQVKSYEEIHWNTIKYIDIFLRNNILMKRRYLKRDYFWNARIVKR